MPRQSCARTSPSMSHLTQCSLLTAEWTLGKRSVQSVPCLVSSRIRAASRWANNRHPSILLRGARGAGIMFCDHVEGDAMEIFEHACKLGYEGIVSKRR